MRTTKQNTFGFGETKTPYPILARALFLFLALYFLAESSGGMRGVFPFSFVFL
jgi:hypothetical protein